MCNLDLIVCENYWLCNLGTIFKDINRRKDLSTVLRNRSSRQSMGQVSTPPGGGGGGGIFGDNDFWIAQYVFSISACLQDELLFF